ncbi:MAG TPA: ATP-binding protein [Bryobacteraceae bacterium]|nr:ATP-binding protein [Bryobacteraceae bacterium]
MTSFKALIEKSPDVILVVTSQGEMLYASASSARVFGYLPQELVGRTIFELIHFEDRDPFGRAFQEVVARPAAPIRVQARVCRKDRQWSSVESTFSNLLDDAGVAGIVVNYRELNARTAPKQQKHQHGEELPPPNTDFEDFASTVAHDLREPLRTISMFTDLLVQGLQDDPDRRQLAKVITDAVARASTLLDGLYSMVVPGLDDPPRPVNLGHIVADALQNLAATIDASAAIVTVDPLPEVQANPNHLVRVFQNLIANAIKYRNDEPIRIRVSAEAVGPSWIIKVKDNGIGIAQEYHECVFHLLKRLHGQEISGAGMGLSVCKKLIDASGGAIWVESEPGAGSTFCFTIPAAMEKSAIAALPVEHRYANGSLAKRPESSPMRTVAHRAG